MSLRRALLVLLIANAVAASPALPQLLGDRVEANCSFAAAGERATTALAAVLCGLPPEQIAGLVKLAASPSAGDRVVLLVRLHAIVPRDSRFPVEAVARFLEILHEQPIDEAKLADRFARIAREHGRLVQEIRAFPLTDPEVQALRDAAAAALQGAPDHDRARADLEEARHLVRAKRAAGMRGRSGAARRRTWCAQRPGSRRHACASPRRPGFMNRRPGCCRRRIARGARPIGNRRASDGPTRAGTSATIRRC